MSLDLNFHKKHFGIFKFSNWQLQWIYDVIESSTCNSNLLTHSAKEKNLLARQLELAMMCAFKPI